MNISSITDRYISQGRSACKAFYKTVAVSRQLEVLAFAWAIVAISPQVASAEATNCTKPGPALSRFAPAVPPRPATEEPFFDAADGPVRLSDFKGRGLLVNFWATWCPPCIKELPALSRAKDILADNNIDVIALSVDRGGAPVVHKFLSGIDINNLDVLIDKKSRVSRKMRSSGLPTTILIDATGKERGRVVGYAEWDDDDTLEFIRRCIAP